MTSPGDAADAAQRKSVTADLNRAMAKGAAWMLAFRWVVRGLGLVSTVILARLLLPADFGLVAMAMIVYALLNAMSEFGFDLALIRDQEASRADYDSAWTLQILRGAVMAALIAGGAHAYAAYFDEPRLEAILYMLAVAALFEGFVNIGIVDFRKKLAFSKDFSFNFYAKLVSVSATIVFAFATRSYWALVVGMLTMAGCKLVLSYAMSSYRPRLGMRRAGEIFRFSKWIILNNLVNYAFARGPSLVLGKLVGVSAVGLYEVANDIARMPTNEFVAPIRRAVYPGYAAMNQDLDRLREGFLNVLSVVAMLSLPIGVGIYLVSVPIVHIFLGPNWIDLIPLLQVLAIAGTLAASIANSGPVFMAMNRPQMSTYVGGACSLFLIPAMLYGIEHFGILGVGYALLAAGTLQIVLSVAICCSLLKLSANTVLATVWRSFASVMAMAATVSFLQHLLQMHLGAGYHLLDLIAAVVVGAMSYAGIHLLLWRLCGAPNTVEAWTLQAMSSAVSRCRIA